MDNQQGNSGLGGGLGDLISTNKGGVQNLSLIAQILSSVFPRVFGSFTLSAATATIVTQPGITSASSIVFAFPANGTAALIVRTNGLFQSITTAGVGFTMSTQLGSATASGTFNYFVINPV